MAAYGEISMAAVKRRSDQFRLSSPQNGRHLYIAAGL
jgi:hypothetical protein